MAEELPSFEAFKGPLEEEKRGRGRFPKDETLRRHSNPERAWKGRLGDRARVARQMPQAVLKIVSHGRGNAEARKLVRYIGKHGEKGEEPIAVEAQDGTLLESREELEALADEWAADFIDRKSSIRKTRDVMHLVVSSPPGTNREKVKSAAREFFAETFGENYDYVFAGHEEKEHYHVHLVLKMRGHDGKQLRATRKDPDLWRQKFAERARANGVALDASPRWARGKGRRSSPPTAIFEIRRRGEVPERDQEAAEAALRRARDADDRPTEHEEAIRAINDFERLEFAKQAIQAVGQAKSLPDDRQRLKALEMASDLAVYAEQMPSPKSRDEVLIAAVKPGEGGPLPQLEAVRKLTKLTERGLRDQVKTFKDPVMQRSAIAARVRVSGIIKARDRSPSASTDRDVDR